MLRCGTKRRWSFEEDSTFSSFFSLNIKNKKMTSASDLIKAGRLLPNRTAAQIRTRLNNVIKNKQKNAYALDN